MAFIPTPHAVRIVINWEKGTERYSNVFHAVKTDYTLQDQTTLADNVDQKHSLAGVQNFSSDVRYLNTSVYDIRTSDGPIVVDSTNSRVGGATADTVPINTAVCVTLRTAARGRSGRGRSYIAGIDETQITDGEWTAAGTGIALTYVSDIKAAIEASGFTLVIRSTQQDNIPLSTAVTRTVTTLSVRGLRVATQRRRVDRA